MTSEKNGRNKHTFYATLNLDHHAGFSILRTNDLTDFSLFVTAHMRCRGRVIGLSDVSLSMCLSTYRAWEEGPGTSELQRDWNDTCKPNFEMHSRYFQEISIIPPLQYVLIKPVWGMCSQSTSWFQSFHVSTNLVKGRVSG